MKKLLIICISLFIASCDIYDSADNVSIVTKKEILEGKCIFTLSPSANNTYSVDLHVGNNCDYGLNIGDTVVFISKQKYRSLTGGM